MKNRLAIVCLASALNVSVTFGQTTESIAVPPAESPGLGLPADFPFELPTPQSDFGPGVLPTTPAAVPLPGFDNSFFDAPPLDSNFFDNGTGAGAPSGEQLRREAESIAQGANRQRGQQQFPSLGRGLENNYRLQQQLRDLSNFLRQQEQDQNAHPAFNDEPGTGSSEENPWFNP